jgi:hypothetical protein
MFLSTRKYLCAYNDDDDDDNEDDEDNDDDDEVHSVRIAT